VASTPHESNNESLNAAAHQRGPAASRMKTAIERGRTP
jgi:hypothetical protein